MLRPTSLVAVIFPLFWAGVSGQDESGPPPYVVPAAVALNSTATSSSASSSQGVVLTSINAPTFGQLGPTFSQKTISSFTPIQIDLSSSSSSVSSSSLPVTTQAPDTTSSTATLFSSTSTASATVSTALSFTNGTITGTSTAPSNTSTSIAQSSPSVPVVEVSVPVTVVVPNPSPPVLTTVEVERSESASSVISSTSLSPIIVSTVSLLLNTPAPNVPLSSSTVLVTVPSEVTVTALAPTGGPIPPLSALSGISGSPVSLPLVTTIEASIPATMAFPSSCTATVTVTMQIVTVTETIYPPCPISPPSQVTPGGPASSPIASVQSVSIVSQTPVAAPSTPVVVPWPQPALTSTTSALASETSEVCPVSGADNSTECQPGVSKLFGPIVVDVLVEQPPSTFSTVTVYTTSGFITQTAGSTTGAPASSPLPASCNSLPSGDVVCSGCPTNLFGGSCAYVCNVVGSTSSDFFCEQSDMTGIVAADQGVIECVPCSSISSTLIFAPTGPIVKGVTGAPAATVTFTQTPSNVAVSAEQPGTVTQPDFLSAATVVPPEYGQPATSSVLPPNAPSTTRSSFTLVALSSPPVPNVELTVVSTSGALLTTTAVAAATLPASTVVMSLPQLSTGVNTATVFSSLAVAASSVPRSPQAATTGGSGTGTEASCTQVAAGAKPSPAYTDQQNGMLYRIQCGTTLDLVLQCPYLCSEGGGGLFRQCENNDQSGLAPTPGGVGIVCQKCLPPCGSSAKRGLESEADLSGYMSEVPNEREEMIKFFRGETIFHVEQMNKPSLTGRASGEKVAKEESNIETPQTVSCHSCGPLATPTAASRPKLTA